MTTRRITERFAFSKSGRVRRDGDHPVVEGVIICGFTSANGRLYKPGTWSEGRVERYNLKPVYCNHSDRRDVESKIGWFENCRLRQDGRPEGDLHLNPKHPLTESVLWAVEHQPSFYMLSHTANCRTS